MREGGVNVGTSERLQVRVNIEASAALAEWIKLYRADGGGRIYTRPSRPGHQLLADAEHYPNRVLANALLYVAWRNGPVENIHAGWARGYVLTHRRITPSEERELMRIASDRLALGMTVCLQLAMERPRRSWPEHVLPFGFVKMMLITPSGWTLTESSREVRLPE